jgi:oxalate decarboxylase/phosphoglucose isomerase-like protein (cupin superfamily)
MTELTLIRQPDAKVLLEGNEFVRIYAHTDKLLFAVASIPAGLRGPLDPGHAGAHEVAYVIKGHFVFEFPNSHKFIELREGDAVLIPEGEAHCPVNIGEELGVVSWSLAPHMGRDDLPSGG